MNLEEARFLETVKNGRDMDDVRQERQEQRIFIVRNTLNCLFIILALVAMAGIGYYWYSGNAALRLWSIGIGIIAVLLKMVEATLRMSSMVKKPQGIHSHKRKVSQDN